MTASTEISREPTYPDLSGKRVLITGSGGGLGFAMATAFARNGCRLIINDIDDDAARRACRDIEAIGAEAVACAGSVVDEQVLDAMFQSASDTFGGVDVLVNNAGISGIAPTLELTREKWNNCLDVNLTAPLRCAQRAAAEMIDRGAGAILNISSIYGLTAAPERAAYCATKAALAMITKVMAIEWAKTGVRVNALAPSYVRTAFVEELLAAGRIDAGALVRRTPSGRLASPEEVAHLALFLASDAAASITGQVVAVDGGWTSYGYV